MLKLMSYKTFFIKFKHCFSNLRSFQGENHFQGVFKDLAVFQGVFQACANHAIMHILKESYEIIICYTAVTNDEIM